MSVGKTETLAQFRLQLSRGFQNHSLDLSISPQVTYPLSPKKTMNQHPQVRPQGPKDNLSDTMSYSVSLFHELLNPIKSLTYRYTRMLGSWIRFD